MILWFLINLLYVFNPNIWCSYIHLLPKAFKQNNVVNNILRVSSFQTIQIVICYAAFVSA